MTRELARPVAVALLRRADELLVAAVPDSVEGVVGWRPPGGTIEFGERGSDTVVREIQEELGVEVVEPSYLGTVENIFVYLGAAAHELVRVYMVRFADQAQCQRDQFDCIEANGAQFTCIWKSIGDFRAGAPLYPAGLLELLG